MTHDELLARIAKLSITPETNVVPSELATALMAVVELHKPNDNDFDFPDQHEYCVICPDFKYPCQTIRAIEKELT